MPQALTAARGDALDWDGFLAGYYPRSRRHDLAALTAYGAYRRAHAAGAAQPRERSGLGAWEDEGGATQ